MAFIFNMRSVPVENDNNESSVMHSTSPTSRGGLPAIAEDRNSYQTGFPPVPEDEEEVPRPDSFTLPRGPPVVPPRAWNRPAHRLWGLGAPPRLHMESSPPAYSQFDDRGVEGPNGEKLTDVRKAVVNNKHIAKRGGWRRLACWLLIALVILGVALGVGLGVGLNHNSSSSSNSNGGSSAAPPGGASGSLPLTSSPSNDTFPAGRYSIDVFLAATSTNCSSNPLTWTCSSSYVTPQGQSGSTFNWIVTPASSSTYQISSTDNIFNIMFANLSLSLMNKGQTDEHYFFQTTMDKPTYPARPLGQTNLQATCYFNSTTFQASLYTRKAKTFVGTNGTESFPPWPFAVQVEQVSLSGAGTPDCLDPSGNSLGDFSTTAGQSCDCSYLNSGT